jgi:hypothetical protein
MKTSPSFIKAGKICQQFFGNSSQKEFCQSFQKDKSWEGECF